MKKMIMVVLITLLLIPTIAYAAPIEQPIITPSGIPAQQPLGGLMPTDTAGGYATKGDVKVINDNIAQLGADFGSVRNALISQQSLLPIALMVINITLNVILIYFVFGREIRKFEKRLEEQKQK
jgi:hypothetical protein